MSGNGHTHFFGELYTSDNCAEGPDGTITIRSTVGASSLIMTTAMAEDLAEQLRRRVRYNREAKTIQPHNQRST